MIARMMLAAIAAGLFAGLVMAVAQQVKTVPLIVQAETYESGQAHNHESAEAHTHDAPAAATGTTSFGLSRFGGTLISSLVTGAGFGLLLAGVALVASVPLTVRSGLLLGAAGWVAVQLLPSVGLPPELPGFPATDLQARQIWWVATVLLSGAGLYLVFLRKEAAAIAAGLLLLTAPHLYGAPRPADMSSAVPAYLAAEYVTAALATTLFSWLVLGAALGWLAGRFGFESAP